MNVCYFDSSIIKGSVCFACELICRYEIWHFPWSNGFIYRTFSWEYPINSMTKFQTFWIGHIIWVQIPIRKPSKSAAYAEYRNYVQKNSSETFWIGWCRFNASSKQRSSIDSSDRHRFEWNIKSTTISQCVCVSAWVWILCSRTQYTQ